MKKTQKHNFKTKHKSFKHLIQHIFRRFRFATSKDNKNSPDYDPDAYLKQWVLYAPSSSGKEES